jgi:glutathionylspermidine synthase
MSRVIVIEMPDKYQATTRAVMAHIWSKYPDAGLLLSATFQWWNDLQKSSFNVGRLPLAMRTGSVTGLVELMKNPQSYEERTK